MLLISILEILSQIVLRCKCELFNRLSRTQKCSICVFAIDAIISRWTCKAIQLSQSVWYNTTAWHAFLHFIAFGRVVAMHFAFRLFISQFGPLLLCNLRQRTWNVVSLPLFQISATWMENNTSYNNDFKLNKLND